MDFVGAFFLFFLIFILFSCFGYCCSKKRRGAVLSDTHTYNNGTDITTDASGLGMWGVADSVHHNHITTYNSGGNDITVDDGGCNSAACGDSVACDSAACDSVACDTGGCDTGGCDSGGGGCDSGGCDSGGGGGCDD